MRNLFVFLVALLALPASAQEVEVRGGVAVGSQSETYAALEMQPRFSGDVFVSYGVWRSVSAFGGFSFNSFGCKDALCLGGVTVTNLHGIAGAEYRRWLFWGRVGGMYGQVKMKGTAVDGSGDVHGRRRSAWFAVFNRGAPRSFV